jgi:hypothetical protein
MTNVELITQCEHVWEVVWLTEDLEGYICKLCGYETIEINLTLD